MHYKSDLSVEELARSALREYKGMRSATQHLVQYHNVDKNLASVTVFKENEKIKDEMKSNHLIRFIVSLPVCIISILSIFYFDGFTLYSIAFLSTGYTIYSAIQYIFKIGIDVGDSSIVEDIFGDKLD